MCLAGGVALNCLAVGRIIKEKIADSVYLCPASSDAGCALGAAHHLASSRSENYKKRPLKNAYLGNIFTDEEIEKAWENTKHVCK